MRSGESDSSWPAAPSDVAPSVAASAFSAPAGAAPPPLVTVIVLGYDSKVHLEDCFSSLLAADEPSGGCRLMFVDNASSDGSSEFVRRRFPQVLVVECDCNLGFAGGNNVGARHAASEWIAFLNPDMRVAPDWLTVALRVAQREPAAECIACRIMSWDGRLVDYAGGSMNFYGYGMQDGVGAPLSDDATRDRDVLFACGGAMLVRTDVFQYVGGFDGSYFAFLEDVDLGWRLWLTGHRVRYAGMSVVYHRHHGSFARSSDRARLALSERNAFLGVLKNYDDGHLARVLPAAAQLMAFRAYLSSGIDAAEHRPRGSVPRSHAWGPYRWARDAVLYYTPRAWNTLTREGPLVLARKALAEARRRRELGGGFRVPDRRRRNQPSGGTESAGSTPAALDSAGRRPVADPPDLPTVTIPDRTLAYFDAARDLLAAFEGATMERARIQAARRRPDREVFPLFRKALVPNYPDREHFRALQVACDLWSLYGDFAVAEEAGAVESRAATGVPRPSDKPGER